MRTVVLCLALLLVDFSSSVHGLQCVDEDGTAVDWLVIYKLPREAKGKKEPRGIIADGKVTIEYQTPAYAATSYTLYGVLQT